MTALKRFLFRCRTPAPATGSPEQIRAARLAELRTLLEDIAEPPRPGHS